MFVVVLGSFVALATAVPDPVTYELGTDAGKFFAINDTTGIITVQSRFDREVCGAKIKQIPASFGRM